MRTWHLLYSNELNKFRMIFGRRSELVNGAVGDGGIYYSYIGVI